MIENRGFDSHSLRHFLRHSSPQYPIVRIYRKATEEFRDFALIPRASRSFRRGFGGGFFNGHRLRSRPGYCIQCDTSRIAFVKRHHDAAYIYIAGSLASKVVKVGNAIWPERRVGALNTRYYGGITDCVMLYHSKFPRCAAPKAIA